MAGNRGPMMVETKGLKDANVVKPQWSPDEEEVRDEVIKSVDHVGGFSEAGLKKQITVDMSSPVVGGKVSTPHGWVDVSKVKFLPPNPTNKQNKSTLANKQEETGVAASKGPPGLAALLGKGPPGKGRGAGLGALFAGGMKPNPGGLKGGSGKGPK
eukprot:GFUD01014137.1.p1 GENE.GFUD01014137.1~~GFUD01014137.1.p1  ORF type:complete len:177 (-),score=59.19 GFUD01014137.1:70-537(-)